MIQDLSYLVFRVLISAMMLFGHGWGKLSGFSTKALLFADPFGLGSNMSLGLAVFAEALCPIFVAFGLMTRLASIPIIVTMYVAAFIIHAADPFSRKEMAILYLISFAFIFLQGSGRYSLQHLFKISSSSRSSLVAWLLK